MKFSVFVLFAVVLFFVKAEEISDSEEQNIDDLTNAESAQFGYGRYGVYPAPGYHGYGVGYGPGYGGYLRNGYGGYRRYGIGYGGLGYYRGYGYGR